MNELHADPLTADVATDQTSSSSSYGDLTTTGPAVTKTLVAGQKAIVVVSSFNNTAEDGAYGYMSFAVSGASTQSASDANAARYFSVKTGSSTAGSAERQSVYTATSGGSHTFTSKYRALVSVNPIHWESRRIVVKPF